MTSPFSLHCRRRFAPSPALQKGGREPLGGTPRSFGKPHPGFAACGPSTVPDKLTRILSLIVAQPHPALQALPPSLSAVFPENFLREAGGKTAAANILSTWQKDMVQITDTPSPARADHPFGKRQRIRISACAGPASCAGRPEDSAWGLALLSPAPASSLCRLDFPGTGGAGHAYPDNKTALGTLGRQPLRPQSRRVSARRLLPAHLTKPFG